MLKTGLFGLLWKLFLYCMIFAFAVAVWTYAVGFALYLAYGTIVSIETGDSVYLLIKDLWNSSIETNLSALSDKLFSNIPFADFFNAVFINRGKVILDWDVLFTDIVKTALSGLIFFILTRINVVFQKILKNQLIFAVVTSIWMVASICSALVLFAFLESIFDDTKLYIVKCILLVASILLHTVLLFAGLKGTHFVRVLLHNLVSLIDSMGNNLVLFLCSYYSVYFMTTCRMDIDTAGGYCLYGSFITFVVYSLIRNAITSVIFSFRL
ncbi:MAG: hypothetical protein IJO14_06645 [Clostridia bacterium]|nr:hypothetical protein [Clostridia bacterium]